MFVEPLITEGKRGWIEVICGSMFSGKTEELIRRLKRAQIAHLKVAIFKPAVDTRYHADHIVSHDERALTSIAVDRSTELLEHCQAIKDLAVAAIDEAQFFDDHLPQVCEQLAARGIRVIAAGLDMDYKGQPYGPVPALLAKADYITKLHAICMQCGNIASFTYRKSQDTEQFKLGKKDLYEPRCRDCFFKGQNSGKEGDF